MRVIQDLHGLIAHDPNPQHKVIYTQCLQALLKVQAEIHQGAAQVQQSPRGALVAALGAQAGAQ